MYLFRKFEGQDWENVRATECMTILLPPTEPINYRFYAITIIFYFSHPVASGKMNHSVNEGLEKNCEYINLIVKFHPKDLKRIQRNTQANVKIKRFSVRLRYNWSVFAERATRSFCAQEIKKHQMDCSYKRFGNKLSRCEGKKPTSAVAYLSWKQQLLKSLSLSISRHRSNFVMSENYSPTTPPMSIKATLNFSFACNSDIS